MVQDRKMKLLTVTEAAAKSGLSVELIRRACNAGKIDGAELIGKTWVFTPSAFDDWYSTRRPRGNPDWSKQK